MKTKKEDSSFITFPFSHLLRLIIDRKLTKPFFSRVMTSIHIPVFEKPADQRDQTTHVNGNKDRSIESVKIL